MFTLEKRPTPSKAWAWGTPFLAVALTMMAGGLLFAALGKDPFAVVRTIFWDPLFGEFAWYLRGQLLVKAAPLTLIAVGLALGFRAGIWNIGAEGQYIIGAITGAASPYSQLSSIAIGLVSAPVAVDNALGITAIPKIVIPGSTATDIIYLGHNNPTNPNSSGEISIIRFDPINAPNLTQLDAGSRKSVRSAGRTPRTLQIAVPALILATLLGIPLGILAARTRGKMTDLFTSMIAVAAFSLPSFVSGLLLVILFSINLQWLPSSGWVSPTENFTGFLSRIILPTIALAVAPTGLVMRMMRSMLTSASVRISVLLGS